MLPGVSARVAALAAALAAAPLALAQDLVPITGVPVAPNAAIPQRQNINDMHASGGPAWYAPSRPYSVLPAAPQALQPP